MPPITDGLQKANFTSVAPNNGAIPPTAPGVHEIREIRPFRSAEQKADFIKRLISNRFGRERSQRTRGVDQARGIDLFQLFRGDVEGRPADVQTPDPAPVQ